MLRCGLLLAAAALAACGGNPRAVVDARKVPSASGKPSVTRVVDLGAMSSLPASGTLSVAGSDGRYLIGELVLIEGEDFGKLPTLSIGGEPAEVLMRTASGGMVARIPAGVGAGEQDVRVSHPEGEGSRAISIERLALVGDQGGGQVHVVSVDPEGLEERAVLESADLAGLAMSEDGQAGYLLKGKESSELWVVAMAHQSGPTIVQRKALEGCQAKGFIRRQAGPYLAVNCTEGVLLVDARVPTAVGIAARIQGEAPYVTGVIGGDKGEHLALLSGAANQVHLYSLSEPTQPKKVGVMGLLASEPVALLRDASFSPSFEELWVMSGDHAGSLAAGQRKTQLHRLRLPSGENDGEQVGSSEVASAGVPSFFVSSREEAVMAAAAIRSTQARATMLIGSFSEGHFDGGNGSESKESQLYKVDLEGRTQSLMAGEALYHAAEILAGQEWALLAFRLPSSGTHGIELLSLESGESKRFETGEAGADKGLASVYLAVAP